MAISAEDAELFSAVLAIDDEEPGPARDARLVEAVARADAEGLHHASFAGRMVDSRQAMMDHDLDALARSTAWIEQHWELWRDDLDPLMGRHVATSWWGLLTSAVDVPAVPLGQLRALHRAFADWCTRLGITQRETHYFAFRIATFAGPGAEHVEAAAEALRRWRSTPVDHDLPVVEVGHHGITWLTAQGRYDDAVGLHREALGGDDVTPSETMVLHGAVLAPLLALGRTDEAERVHAGGLTSHGEDANGAAVAPHLSWCAHTGRHDEGLALLRPYALLVEPEARAVLDASRWLLDIAAHAAVLLRSAAAAGLGERRLVMPLDDDADDETRRQAEERAHTVAELGELFTAMAAELADGFDTVSGTVSDRPRLEAFWRSSC